MAISDNPNRFGEQAHDTVTGGWRAAPARLAPDAQRRKPSLLANFMFVAGATCAGLFVALWWALDAAGDEMPWLPAGLIAGIAMIALVIAREIAVRRYETRSVLRQRRRRRQVRDAKARLGQTTKHSAPLGALRALERRLAKLDSPQSTAAQHLEAYRACEKYLAQVPETLARAPVEFEIRAALRAGIERVRLWQRRHLLAWARKESQRLLAEAHRQTNPDDRIGTAEAALGVLAEAARIYPDEPELAASALAVREFIASVHVAHWVERAEREAFKGNYAKAIDHYSDALFDLTRANIGEDARREAADRITREVQLLRARQSTVAALDDETGRASGRRDAQAI